MKTRDHLLEHQDDMGTAGTLTYNLDFTDPITCIELTFGGTNGATSNKENPIERNISKIEIVDGGEVLWDLPGDVALALASHLQGSVPNRYYTEVPNDGPYQKIPLMFGRYLYDHEYGFNPNAHRNPQLKITFNEATVNAAGASGFVSDSLTVDILVRLMEDVSPPQAFLSCRDVYQYTSLASGDTRIEMPTDRILRMLIVRAYESEVDLRASITNYELSADGGKFVPFDLPSGTIVGIMSDIFPKIDVNSLVRLTDATRCETWVGIDDLGQLTSRADDYIAAADTFWPASVYPYVFGHAGGDGTDVDVFMSVAGWCMHNTVLKPFGRLVVPDDWFDVRGYRQLDLFLTNGNAGAEVNIGVQQVYPY